MSANFSLGKLVRVAFQKANQQNNGSNGSGSTGKLISGIIGLVSGASLLTYGLGSMIYKVDAGRGAVVFNKFTGLDHTLKKEGIHLRIPFFEEVYSFDLRTKPTSISSPTGTRDLQTVDISLRVLFRPDPSKIGMILSTIGQDFDERVFPSIANETLKAVVAQFNASELITQREQVSKMIAQVLTTRARDFHMILEDVSITHLTFGQEYRNAVEAKQVAQQDAERAKFVVKQALQDKKSTIIKAEGEAKSAELIGLAIQKNPGYLELRRLDAANIIAETIAQGNNTVYLDSRILQLAAPVTKP